MEESKDEYLGEASKAEIRDAPVRHLVLEFVGAEGRERVATAAVDRMNKGKKTGARCGITSHTSALSRPTPTYGPRLHLSPRPDLWAHCRQQSSTLCQSTLRFLELAVTENTPSYVGPVATQICSQQLRLRGTISASTDTTPSLTQQRDSLTRRAFGLFPENVSPGGYLYKKFSKRIKMQKFHKCSCITLSLPLNEFGCICHSNDQRLLIYKNLTTQFMISFSVLQGSSSFEQQLILFRYDTGSHLSSS
jgi:hypothetical protein